MYADNPNELDQLLISAEANRIADEIPQRGAGGSFVVRDDLKIPLAPNTRRAFLVHERGGGVVRKIR